MFKMLALSMLFALPAAADIVSGYAVVTDGDTLQVADVKVRLAGMDAPERHQMCGDEACGVIATATLTNLIAGDIVTCDLNGGPTYDRIAGTCSTPRITDLGGAMVMAGYAMDEPRYQPDYTSLATQAERARQGMWANPVQSGWEWRAAQVVSTPHDGDCDIKGNISANGRIYHVPGSRYYDRTSINASERWFCSVAQAEAAGWRAPR